MLEHIIKSRVGFGVKVLFAAGFFILLLFLVKASDISSFETDLIADAQQNPVISIEVQDHVYFGEISKGEQTSNVRVNVTNTGNVAVVVTPRLVSGSEVIFNYTYFQRRTTEPYYKIGSFSFNISAPSSLGANRSDYCYAKLDLRNYTGNIPADVNGYSTNVKFFAVAQ